MIAGISRIFEFHHICDTNSEGELSTNDKTLANGIFDLKQREYSQKEFSWIYSDSARKAVQNGNKMLI
jgi:hypothetical protein